MKKFMRKTDVLLCPYRIELIFYVHTNNRKKKLVVNEWGGKNAELTHNK